MYLPLIELRATEANYSRSVSDIVECKHTQGTCPPTNWTESYTGWLHQVSKTYWRMQTYLGQMYPPSCQSSLVPQNPSTPHQFYMCKNAHIPNRKSDIFWYRLIWVMLLHTQNTSNMQDPCRRQPPQNTDHGWATGKWHKSLMQPYINMRTISNANHFTHILPLTISCITTPRYYFHGTGRCIPHQQHYVAHFIFSYCRGKSCIGIGYVTSWTLSNLCRLLCVVVTVSFCCCSPSVIVDPQLQMNNTNNITQ